MPFLSIPPYVRYPLLQLKVDLDGLGNTIARLTRAHTISSCANSDP